MDPDYYLTQPFWTSDDVECLGRECSELGGLSLPRGAVLFESSGSSGLEKWVVHTRESLRASAQAVNAYLEVTASDVIGLCLPYWHVGGFGVLARSFFSGARCSVYKGKWDAFSVQAFLFEEQVTVTSMVPTQIYDLVRAELKAPSSLRFVIVGGGRLSLELGQAARELGWNVLQSYGMSEAGSQIATAAVSSLSEPFRNDTLCVLPSWDVETLNDGQLRIGGPSLAAGILTRISDLEYMPLESGFLTQDRVEISGGALTFLGRLDRTVKIKGELVDLDRMEKELSVFVASEVVILPEEDHREGAFLHVFIKSGKEVGCREVTHFMPPYITVKSCHVIESFPTSALGKIDRRALKTYFA